MVSQLMEADRALVPMDIGLLGADRVPAQADGFAEAVSELLLRYCRPPPDSVVLWYD